MTPTLARWAEYEPLLREAMRRLTLTLTLALTLTLTLTIALTLTLTLALTSAVRGDPRHAASWVACGLLLERRRRKEAAWRCLQTARLVAPDSYYVHQVVGQAHVRRGELGLAREAFRRSLVLNKRNAATMHAWGVLEWRCGHTDAARALFDKALKASPSNRYVLQSWACLEARAGASKEAKVRIS